MKRTTVYIPEELHAKVRKSASINRRSFNSELLYIVESNLPEGLEAAIEPTETDEVASFAYTIEQTDGQKCEICKVKSGEIRVTRDKKEPYSVRLFKKRVNRNGHVEIATLCKRCCSKVLEGQLP